MSCQHFKENHPNCTECNRNPIINAAENRSKYSLLNPKRREVCKIRVDGCVITQVDGKQCDYLFLACDTSIVFFVELKGSDLSHAIDQINQSIDLLAANLGGSAINARVVLSKTQTPDLRTPKYKKFKQKIHGLGGTFIHKNIVMEEVLG